MSWVIRAAIKRIDDVLRVNDPNLDAAKVSYQEVTQNLSVLRDSGNRYLDSQKQDFDALEEAHSNLMALMGEIAKGVGSVKNFLAEKHVAIMEGEVTSDLAEGMMQEVLRTPASHWVINAADKPKEEPRGQFKPTNLSDAPGMPLLDPIHAIYMTTMAALDDIGVKGGVAIEGSQNETMAREIRNYVMTITESLIVQSKKIKDVVATAYVNKIDTDTGEVQT